MNVGTPPPVFLPARMHKHKYVSDNLEVEIPTRGRFPNVEGPEAEYDISPEPGVVLMGTLTQALFAHRTYPNLQDNQRFVLLGVEVTEDKTYVVGRVLEMEND